MRPVWAVKTTPPNTLKKNKMKKQKKVDSEVQWLVQGAEPEEQAWLSGPAVS